MRAHEFIKENASAGGTSSSNVATVVKPQITTKDGETMFGGSMEDHPEYGNITKVTVIRRPSPTAEAAKK